jgi:propanol-preferring alcohol dehydrogenase
MKAARIVKLNEPLQVQEFQTRTPKGTGGLGLMAIQLVNAVIGANIITMDLDDNKLDVAKKNCADNTINSKKEDPVKAIMELTNNMGGN